MHALEWIDSAGTKLRSIGSCRLRKVLNRTRGQCTWCGVAVSGRRRTWCSQECIDAFLERQPARAREIAHTRDRGVCQLCGCDTVRIKALLYKLRWSSAPEARAAYQCYEAHLVQLGFKGKSGQLWRYDLWEADHIIPVVLGGGLCGPEGYRVLCIPCHKKVTARLNQTLRTDKEKTVPLCDKESPAARWLKNNADKFETVDGLPTAEQRAKLYGQIAGGRHVAIVTAHGQIIAGRAVLRGPAGWVLNCPALGEARPQIADEHNTVYVAGGRL